MTLGLPCYFLLSNLPLQRKICSSVAMVNFGGAEMALPQRAAPYFGCNAPYLGCNASCPSHCSHQAGQCAACSRDSVASHYCFPWENTTTRIHATLSFSPQIYLPPHKVAILVQVQEVWPAM